MVLHWLADDGIDSSQVGFVVSKAVGNAVVRNRVQRRLRHLTREHLQELPGRGVLVVRANPAAAEASYATLKGDLTKGLVRLQPAGSPS
ncbi:ribonuclease P protein component [Nocardioides daphniae]|uniref:Ribonuclease P protein component n=1 Tax=Nocardioides daphniae TaxID=402297 RepID=A0A4P7UE31_9ACTN|nr:ribonuclease P protein component [Nocardioides daphniae]QCC78543.1 ribonuclease P protein component [Nocardioides daphniae]